MKIKRKPKLKRRDSLDVRIAKAATFEEKSNLALFGRETRPAGLELLVQCWRTINAERTDKSIRTAGARAHYNSLSEDTLLATVQYIILTMSFDKPDMLIALAKEMKRQSKAKWRIDKVRFLLLHLGQMRALNLSNLQRVTIEANFASADLRTWRRIAHRLKIKTVGPGRPHK